VVGGAQGLAWTPAPGRQRRSLRSRRGVRRRLGYGVCASSLRSRRGTPYTPRPAHVRRRRAKGPGGRAAM